MKKDTSEYLNNLVYAVKEVLTSPESALLLREVYLDNFTSKLSSDEELVFGDTLYREEECTVESNSYSEHLKDYITYDIQKYFGLNINEYIGTTTFMKMAFIKEALFRLEQLNRERDELKRKNGDLLDDIDI